MCWEATTTTGATGNSILPAQSRQPRSGLFDSCCSVPRASVQPSGQQTPSIALTEAMMMISAAATNRSTIHHILTS